MKQQYYFSKLNGSTILNELIKKTMQQTIAWVPFSSVRRYLKENEIPLSRIGWLRKFLHHLQSARFIPSDPATYIAKNDNMLIVVSQSKYSSGLRLDCADLNQTLLVWNKIFVTTADVMRLSRQIEFAGTDSSSTEIEDILYATDHICV